MMGLLHEALKPFPATAASPPAVISLSEHITTPVQLVELELENVRTATLLLFKRVDAIEQTMNDFYTDINGHKDGHIGSFAYLKSDDSLFTMLRKVLWCWLVRKKSRFV